MTLALRFPRPWPRSFRQRLLAGMALALGAAMLLFVTRVVVQQRRDLMLQSEAQGRVFAESLAVSNLSEAIESDLEGLQESLRSAARYPDLRYAMVLAPDGRVLAHTEPERVGQYLSDPSSTAWLQGPPGPVTLQRNAELIEVAAPMLVQDRLVGWVRVGLGQDATSASLRAIRRDGLLFTLLALSLGIITAFLASRRLASGLGRLVALTRVTAPAGAPSVAGADELGELGQAFDRLTQELDLRVRDLQDRETFLQDLMTHLPVAVLVHAPDGTLEFGNPAALALFGLPLDRLRGRSLPELTGPLLGEDGQPMREEAHPILAALRDGRPSRWPIVGFRGPGATLRWFILEVFPELGTGGRVKRLITALLEVTAQEEARKLARKALADLEDLYQNAPCGYHSLGPDGTYLRVNDTELNWLGYSREELVNRKTFLDLATPHSKAAFMEQFSEFKRRGWARDLEYDMVRKDGSILTVLVNASAILGKDGTYQYSRGSLTDVTERMKAERALRASQASLAEAQRIAHLGNWELDLGSNALTWSDEIFRIFELEPGAFGASYEAFLDTVHPEDRERVDQAYRDSVRDRTPYDIVHRLALPDGRIKIVRERGETRYSPEGQPLRTTGTVQDITEQEVAEQERRRLESELQHLQRLESLGSLAGGVAHDMNNILAVILNLAELRLEEAPRTPEAEAFEQVRKACLRGADLVRRLTRFARKEMESAEPIDLNRLVREQAEVLERTTLRKAEWRLDLAPELPAVMGQPAELGNALINLCLNALDAMPRGGTLDLRTRRLPGGGVELCVEDHGVGMPPEVLARALDPFFTTKPVGKGTGLGLAMVYGTMKAHGGSVELQSEVGRGTRAFLRFPPATCLAPAPVPGPGPAAPLPPSRILLVDDDELIRLSVPPLLEALGLQVECVDGGRPALERLAQVPAVDLVILDQNMPQMSGAETLARIRERWPGLPVLMASGYPDPELSRFERMAAIEKPYTLETLRTALAGLLDSARPGG